MSPRYSPDVCCTTATTFIGVLPRAASANASSLLLQSPIRRRLCRMYRVADRCRKVVRRDAQHADVGLVKKLFDPRLDFGEPRTLQVRLEIENDARRRYEEITA